MTTLTIELHSDLARWVERNAAVRDLSLEAATSRLLDEARMRDVGLTRIVAPVPGIRSGLPGRPTAGSRILDTTWSGR